MLPKGFVFLIIFVPILDLGLTTYVYCNTSRLSRQRSLLWGDPGQLFSVHSGELCLNVNLDVLHTTVPSPRPGPKPGLSNALFLIAVLLCLPLSKAGSSSLWPTVNWQAEELKPTDVKQIVPGKKIPTLFLVAFLCATLRYTMCILVDARGSVAFL